MRTFLQASQPISGCHRLVAVGEAPTANGPGEKSNWLSSVSATTVAGCPSSRHLPINEQDFDMLELRLPRFWQRKTWPCHLLGNHLRSKYFAFAITEIMSLNFLAFCFCLFFLLSQLSASCLGSCLLIRHFFINTALHVSVSTLIVVFLFFLLRSCRCVSAAGVIAGKLQ